MGEFLAHLEKTGIPINVAQTVGHTQVRADRHRGRGPPATPEEMERMKALVRESMEGGAIGLSTALIYPPAVYAPEEEIVELAKVVGEYGGRYFTHMRNEGDRLLEAIEEAMRIGKQAADTRSTSFISRPRAGTTGPRWTRPSPRSRRRARPGRRSPPTFIRT